MEYKKFWKKRTALEKILLCCVCVMCIVVIIIFITILSSSGSAVCNTAQCVRGAVHILDHVDPDKDPCENFYNFACGNFWKNAFLRKKPSSLLTLTDLTNNYVTEIITQPINETELPNSVIIQRQFYRSCLNTSNGEKNEKILMNLLDEAFGGWPAIKSYAWIERDFQWTRAITNARKLGLHYKSLLVVGAFSRIFGENMMLWLQPPSRKNVAQFHWKKDHMDTMIQIATHLGAKSIGVTSEIRRTIDFAEQLQEIIEKYTNNITNEIKRYDEEETKDNIYFEEDDREFNITIKDINLFFMQINWLEFLRNITGVNLNENTEIWFGAEDYLKDFYHLMIKTPKRVVANFLAWNVIVDNMAYLSDELNEKYKNILKVDNETLPKRDELCVSLSRKLYRNAAEVEYIRRATTTEKKNYILDMIKYISKQLEISQKASTWMDSADQEFAIKRLHDIQTSIGWTDIVFNTTEYEKMSGFDKLQPTENVVEMARMANKVKNDRFFTLVMENITEMDMFLSSPKLDVNAYYIKLLNKLVLPAPILQNQILEIERPYYMNYGALGTVIGHEYSHGFSGWSSSFSDPGEFWRNQTIENFRERAQCLMDEYETYELEMTGTTDNDTSFEENFADYYGLNLAYRAYQNWVKDNGQEESLPGIKYTSNQIFWIMASTYMCMEPKYLNNGNKNASKDIHGIPSFRVNGRLKSSYEFSKDFQCPEGSRMNPKTKCHIYA